MFDWLLKAVDTSPGATYEVTSHQFQVQDTSSGELGTRRARGREREREREPLFRKFTTIHFWPSTVPPDWRISSCNIHPGSRLCTHPFAFPKVADFPQQYVVWNASSFICLNFIYTFTHPANTDQWSSCFVVQSFQNLLGHAIQLFGLTSRGVCYARLRCATSNSDLLCSVLQARDSGAWSFGSSLSLSKSPSKTLCWGFVSVKPRRTVHWGRSTALHDLLQVSLQFCAVVDWLFGCPAVFLS